MSNDTNAAREVVEKMITQSTPDAAATAAAYVMSETVKRYSNGTRGFEATMNLILDAEKAADDNGWERAASICRKAGSVICKMEAGR